MSEDSVKRQEIVFLQSSCQTEAKLSAKSRGRANVDQILERHEGISRVKEGQKNHLYSDYCAKRLSLMLLSSAHRSSEP